MHGLRSLGLSGNRLGTMGAAALAWALSKGPAPSLRVLRLGENDLGPDGMAALVPGLTSLESLQELNLNANRLTVRGATSLAEALHTCTSLSSLALNFNFLDEQGTRSLAPVLGGLASLTDLDLSFNDMGPGGVSALVEGFSNDNHVGFVRLDLAKNTLGAQGACALFPLLARSATSLAYVSLKFNGLGQQHVAMLNCLVPHARLEVLEC